jgi:hypothetical protein
VGHSTDQLEQADKIMRSTRLLRVTIVIVFFIAWAMVWVGCSPRKMMINQFVRMVETGLPAMEQDDDLQLVAHSMPAHIKLLEAMLANDPNNDELLVHLARLYGGYAFAILETECEAQRFGQASVIAVGIQPNQLEAAVVRTYQRGAAYALRALEVRHPKAETRLSRLKTSEAFIKAMRQGDVPALFWYAFNLGGYIQNRIDSVEAMSQAYLVEKAMRRIVVLDASYYHGGAHLALMTYYASRPVTMGGNPDLARNHLEKHFIVDPGSIMLRSLFWARYALVQQQARKEFTQSLSQVVNKAQAGRKHDMLDKVAALRANIYLEAADQLFDE